MENQYVLEKWEWTENDFDDMGWHDCPIYAIRFDDNIYFDIDYIFKWNNNGAGNSFTFWMAPATLIFENSYYLKIDVALDFINGIEIAKISKSENEKKEIIWDISTQKGEILIGAQTYRQIIRRSPSFQFFQYVPTEERGNISFSTLSDKDYQNSNYVKIKKNDDLRLYELVKKKTSLVFQQDMLNREKLGTEEYLIEKRKIDQTVSKIETQIKGTKFENW